MIKKRLQQWVSILALLSLVFAVLPAHTAAAQTEATASTHYLDDLLTEDTAESEALLLAYEDYKKVLEMFELQDVAVEESNGSTLEEVEGSFEAGVEGEFLELAEGESYISYIYETDSWHNEGEMTQAELILYFVDDVLYYAGVAAIELNVTEADIIPDAEIQGWVDEKVDFSVVVDRAPRVVGVSQMLYDGSEFYQALIPTGDSLEELYGDFMLINEDTVLNSFPLGIAEALDQPQSRMIGLYADYFFPEEEDAIEGEESIEEGTEEGSEQPSGIEESSEDSESTESEVSEPAGQVSTNPLGEIVTEESVHNEALMMAFEEYKKVIDQFEIQDVFAQELTGSSSQDILDNFDTSVEHSLVEMSDTEFYISYIYSSEETSQTTGGPKQAELLLYFIDDVLYYVGTATLDMELYTEDLTEEEAVTSWVEDAADIQTVIDYQPHVMGVSQMNFDGVDYYQLFLPTGTTATEDLTSDFVLIQDTLVLDANRMPMTEAIKSPQTEMLTIYITLSEQLRE